MGGTMGATINDVTLLDAMPDNPAITVRALRRELLDCALKTVEGVGLGGDRHLERLVVIVSALIAFSHGVASLLKSERSAPLFGLLDPLAERR
jgi:hypothetical protein